MGEKKSQSEKKESKTITPVKKSCSKESTETAPKKQLRKKLKKTTTKESK